MKMERKRLVTLWFILLLFTMMSTFFYNKSLSNVMMDKLSYFPDKNTSTIYHKQEQASVQRSTQYIATTISTTLGKWFSIDKNTSTIYHKQEQASVQGNTQYIATTISTTLGKWFSIDDSNKALLQNSSFCPSNMVPVTKRNEPNSTCFKYNWSEKQKILKNLETNFTRRIYKLQNPKNCQTARFLVCSLAPNHGLGSLNHLLAQCMVLALLTHRTMITDIPHSYYNDLENVFLPLSRTCPKVDISKAVDIPERSDLESTSSYRVIKASLSHRLKLKYSLFAMPESMAEVIECLHGDPNAWWIGQILKYLMRINPSVLKNINKVKAQIDFSHPTVGLHIRRGDKHREAKYYPVTNYMAYAERWFDCNYINKGINITKRIYIATDDPGVIEELKKYYQDYRILHDPLYYNVSLTTEKRYEKSSLIRTLTDLHILSECDYFIGTFSSNIGRLIYEMKQTHLDPVYSSISLDRTYYYHQGFLPKHIVVHDQPDDGSGNELKIGDIIAVDSSESSITTAFGRNLRTKVKLKYSIDKVRVLVERASYPDFS